MSYFPVWQTTLMRETGLSEDDFRRLRNRICQKGADWRTGPLNHIEFTAAAAEKIRAAAQQTPATPPATADPASSLEKPPALPVAPIQAQRDVPLTVSKLWPLNPRALEATTDAGQTVTVRLRDSSRLRRVAKITARLVEGNTYEFSGTGRPHWK